MDKMADTKRVQCNCEVCGENMGKMTLAAFRACDRECGDCYVPRPGEFEDHDDSPSLDTSFDDHELMRDEIDFSPESGLHNIQP